MIGIPHRYLTVDLPGVGGEFKQSLEDFIVDEVPLYSPSDKGEHTYFEVEKSDLSTIEAIERISHGLGVALRELGFAGLKDRKGITRQVFSVRLVPPERVLAIQSSQIKVLWARLHTNKLRVGHLRGNRFRIRIRNVEPDQRRIDAIAGVMLRDGIPNFYGPQRFGVRGDSFRIGRALLKKDPELAVRRLLGHPAATERNPHVVEARSRFMAGDLPGALESFPRSYRQERQVLDYLIRSGGNYRGVLRFLAEPIKKLYYSAYQSFLFNRLLDSRLEATENRPGCLWTGDLAWIHRNGAVFKVMDAGIEQPRADGFEISPSGPVYGKKMPLPEGRQADLEAKLLEDEGLRHATFHSLMPGLHMEGGRRPLRVPLREFQMELVGNDLLLSFFLPKGAYATTLLREIMKNDEVPPGYTASDTEPECAAPPAPQAEESGPPDDAPKAAVESMMLEMEGEDELTLDQ